MTSPGYRMVYKISSIPDEFFIPDFWFCPVYKGFSWFLNGLPRFLIPGFAMISISLGSGACFFLMKY
jgi:hypothetical protein